MKMNKRGKIKLFGLFILVIGILFLFGSSYKVNADPTIQIFNFTNLLPNQTIRANIDINVTFNVTFDGENQHNISLLFYNNTGTTFVDEINFTSVINGSLGSYYFNQSNYNKGDTIVLELHLYNGTNSTFYNISSYINRSNNFICSDCYETCGFCNLTDALLEINASNQTVNIKEPGIYSLDNTYIFYNLTGPGITNGFLEVDVPNVYLDFNNSHFINADNESRYLGVYVNKSLNTTATYFNNLTVKNIIGTNYSYLFSNGWFSDINTCCSYRSGIDNILVDNVTVFDGGSIWSVNGTNTTFQNITSTYIQTSDLENINFYNINSSIRIQTWDCMYNTGVGKLDNVYIYNTSGRISFDWTNMSNITILNSTIIGNSHYDGAGLSVCIYLTPTLLSQGRVENIDCTMGLSKSITIGSSGKDYINNFIIKNLKVNGSIDFNDLTYSDISNITAYHQIVSGDGCYIENLTLYGNLSSLGLSVRTNTTIRNALIYNTTVLQIDDTINTTLINLTLEDINNFTSCFSFGTNPQVFTLVNSNIICNSTNVFNLLTFENNFTLKSSNIYSLDKVSEIFKGLANNSYINSNNFTNGKIGIETSNRPTDSINIINNTFNETGNQTQGYFTDYIGLKNDTFYFETPVFASGSIGGFTSQIISSNNTLINKAILNGTTTFDLLLWQDTLGAISAGSNFTIWWNHDNGLTCAVITGAAGGNCAYENHAGTLYNGSSGTYPNYVFNDTNVTTIYGTPVINYNNYFFQTGFPIDLQGVTNSNITGNSFYNTNTNMTAVNDHPTSKNNTFWYNNFYASGFNQSLNNTGCYNHNGNYYTSYVTMILARRECGLQSPQVTLSPSISSNINLWDTISISCDGSDDMNETTLNLLVGGSSVCSSSSIGSNTSTSCSYNYYANQLGQKDIVCQMSDLASNVVESLITFTVKSSSSNPSNTPSSGSSTTKPKTVDVNTPQNVETSAGQTQTFTYGATEHTLRIDIITSDSVTVTIDGKMSLTIPSTESREVDLDGDGTKDIKITLNAIRLNKADITIEKLAGATEDIRNEVETIKSNFGLILISLLSLIIIGIIIYFIYNRYKE